MRFIRLWRQRLWRLRRAWSDTTEWSLLRASAEDIDGFVKDDNGYDLDQTQIDYLKANLPLVNHELLGTLAECGWRDTLESAIDAVLDRR